MLEANTFRTMMMLSGIISVALIVLGVFTLPVVPIEGSSVTNYTLLTGNTPDSISGSGANATADLTVYEALSYSVKGMLRGNVSHY